MTITINDDVDQRYSDYLAKKSEEEQTEKAFDPFDPEEYKEKKERGEKIDEGKGLIETLSEKRNYKVIKDYMSDRFGMEETEYEKRDIIDSYVNQMRRFNSGQSVVTIGELAHLNSGEGNALVARRKKAQNAYQLFDSLGGAFAGNRTFGEKMDAVYDYARAVIVDPVNIASLGVGKLAIMGAAKAAVAGVKEVGFRVGRQAAYQALKGGASKETAKRIQRETTQRAIQEGLKKSKTQELLNKANRKGIYTSLGFDMTAAGGVDVLQQQAEVTAGFKEDIDWFQAGVSTSLGALGGGLQLGLIAISKGDNIPLASIQLQRSDLVRKATDDSLRALSKERRKEILSSENVTKALLQLKKRTAEWAQKVKEGKELALKSENPKTSIDYDTDFAVMFFKGDPEAQTEIGKNVGFDGVVNILAKAGYKQPNDMNFTDFMGEALSDMSPDNKQIIIDAYDTLKKSSDQLTDYNLDEFIKIDAAKVSEAASIMGHRSQAKQLFTKLGLDLDNAQAADLAKAIGDPVDETTRKGFIKKFKPIQDLLIRNIITHPGTTALNIIGWSSATVYQSMSDMVRASLYSGAALKGLVTGNLDNAVKYKNLAVSMMDLQRQKVRNMVDPYATFDSVMDYLAVRPEAQKEMFRYLNGGVEIDGILDDFELNPNSIPKKGNFQKFNEFFETIYGVRAQDFFTKTQEFAYALDKRIRIKYGKSFKEFLEDPDLVRHLTDKGSEKFNSFLELETGAVEDALRNTFSKSYGGNDGFIQNMAKLIEQFRSLPGLGALAPFGQFWNNSVAFMLDHSGISLINKYTVKAGGKSALSRDPIDLLTKSAVGWGAVGVATTYQMENLEEGLAWYEGRDETGAVRSYLYDFPRNVPMLVGRMGAHIVRDGAVPAELLTAFADNFGTRALTDEVGQAFGVVSKGIYLAAEAKDKEVLQNIQTTLENIVSQYVSGMTRRLDPINQAVGLAKGENYKVVDKKEGSKWMNDSTRYVDQIFEALTGMEPGEAIGNEPAAEKQRALTSEPLPVPIGRITGVREVTPSTTIEKLFNDVGRRQWKTEIKNQSAEAVNTFNKYVRPQLEVLADLIIYNDQWDGQSLQNKEKILRNIIRIAKKNTMDQLGRSVDKKDQKTKLIFDIKNKGTKEINSKVLEYFNVTEEDMWRLDIPQLRIIEDMVSTLRAKDRKFGKIIGIE